MNDIHEFIINGTHCIIAKRDGTWISFIFSNITQDVLNELRDARPFQDINIGRCFVSSMFYDQRCIIFKPYHDKLGQVKSEIHDFLIMSKLSKMFPHSKNVDGHEWDEVTTLIQDYYNHGGMPTQRIMLGGMRW